MAVLNFYHFGKQIPPGAVNIMRGTEYGNPFKIGEHGTREQVVEQYRQWLWARLQAEPTFAAKILALKGRDLCCCCAPKACHGDIIEKAAEWLSTQHAPYVRPSKNKAPLTSFQNAG